MGFNEYGGWNRQLTTETLTDLEGILKGESGTLAVATAGVDYLVSIGAHVHVATDITSGTLDGDRLPGLSQTKKGGVTATGVPSGLFLKDDGTWAAAGAVLPQDIATSASPTFVTVKLSGLTDGYVPYHVSDASGLANSIIQTNTFGVGVNGVPSSKARLIIYGTSASSSDGPNLIFMGSGTYPPAEFFTYSNDYSYFLFNAYHDGVANFISSGSGSQFAIYKSLNSFNFAYGIAAAGAGVAWTSLLYLGNDKAGRWGVTIASDCFVGPQADADPMMFFFQYSHDVTGLFFDAYYGVSNWQASDTSSFGFYKLADRLSFVSQTGSTKGGLLGGSTATWNYDAICISQTGLVGIGVNSEISNAAKVEIEDGATAKSILLKITQDDENVFGWIVGNDTYSTTDTSGVSLKLTNAGVGLLGYPTTLRIGGTSDYSTFEADGTLVFTGAATVWKDVNLGAAQLGQPAAGAPDAEKFIDEAAGDTGIYTLAFALNEYVSGSFELQHDYKEASDVTFHVHWQGITAPGGGTDNVKWELTYTVARDGVTLDAATVIVKEVAITTRYAFYRSDFTAITGTNLKIGDQFLFKLKRIAASADEYAGDAYLATCGLHYECDTVGSRAIVAK